MINAPKWEPYKNMNVPVGTSRERAMELRVEAHRDATRKHYSHFVSPGSRPGRDLTNVRLNYDNKTGRVTL